MLRADYLAQQNGSSGPLASEAEPHQRTRREQLFEILRQPGKKREDREP
jgi:hypothetical protein